MTDVRPFRDADLEPLRAILNAVVAGGDAFVYDAPFSADDARRWVASHPAAYVATVEDGGNAEGGNAAGGGRVVGGYVLRANQPGRGSHVANAAYLVDPAARGLGVGRRLGEHSLATAKAMGFAAVQFNAVVATNAAAVALWRSLGFAVVGTVPRAFRRGDGQLVDLLVMHRFL